MARQEGVMVILQLVHVITVGLQAIVVETVVVMMFKKVKIFVLDIVEMYILIFKKLKNI
jgi:hypothetical protein